MLTVLLTLTGFGCLMAWILPESKKDALLGRLSYSQAALAAGLTVAFVCLAVFVFSAMDCRRRRGFRIAAILMGAGSALLLSEAAALLLPYDAAADNPWYAAATGSDELMSDADQLMFVRPAHIEWHGPSRGDYAIPLNLEDPYAREVSFQTDFEGFRNSEDLSQADLIFIGDSFTEAGNVPESETFVRQTAAELKLSTRNLGRASHGPSAELIILRKYGLKCRPRAVVWQICESNDLDDAVNFQSWVDQGRAPFKDNAEPARVIIWRKRSPSYRLFQCLRLSQPQPWPYTGIFRDGNGTPHPMYFQGPPDKSILPVGHVGWNLMSESIRAGADLLRKLKIKLVVVFIPIKMRVMGPYVEFSEWTQQLLPPEWNKLPDPTLAETLGELCSSLDVTYVDTTPILQQRAAAGDLVFLPFDTHLSSQGHTAVATLIVDALGELHTSVSRSHFVGL